MVQDTVVAAAALGPVIGVASLSVRYPKYDALLDNGRKSLKRTLLERWRLPTSTFELCHRHRPLPLKCKTAKPTDPLPTGPVLQPCRQNARRLIQWYQIWLASDEDLYFLLLRAPDAPRMPVVAHAVQNAKRACVRPFACRGFLQAAAGRRF